MNKKISLIYSIFPYGKNGDEKLLSIWWFGVLVIVGVGIITGVIVFYSADVDVRAYESEIMNERIQNCFVDGNFLFDDFKEKNLFLNCSLDKIVFEKESDYFIRVDFLDGNDEVLRESIIEGDSSKEANCFIGDEVEGEDLPKCFSYEKVVYYFADGKKEAKIKILSASNQKGSKVLR